MSDPKYIKTNEKNKMILGKFLKMSPHLDKIMEEALEDLETYKNLVQAYETEMDRMLGLIREKESENSSLREEIRLLKTVH
jgi:hypothetical protein